MVTRRTIFELRKARDRAHILEALAVALANIDPIIELIRRAPTPAEAKPRWLLIRGSWATCAMLERAGDDAARPEWLEPEFGVRDGLYYLTEQQAQAILDLRLQKLTGLEHENRSTNTKSCWIRLRNCCAFLVAPIVLMEVIREELELVREQFGDKRRTEITANHFLTEQTAGTLRDIAQTQRVNTMQRFELTFEVPPAGRHRFKFGNLFVVNVARPPGIFRIHGRFYSLFSKTNRVYQAIP